MALTVKHSKTSAIPDAGDASLVQPSDWNADHTLTGTVPVANGGTGATTANDGLNALLPTQTGNNGKVLSTDGTNTSWLAVGGSGTVTSVGTGTGLSGGPITGAGTINFSNANVATFAATPSSANLAAAVTDETGSGSLVFGTAPTLSAPVIDGANPYIQFNNGSAVTVAAGKLWYDGSTGSWNAGMGGGNITQQIGEELFVYGKASAAITDSPLQIIYHTGTVGASGVITFAPTVSGITDVNAIIGVATENIALNGFGRITSFGVIHGITTNGAAFGETWANDDVIWYNPVTGNPTNVKPVAPNMKVQVGIVINAGAGGSGSFQVLLQSGTQLGGTDSNVQLTSATNGNILTYDGAGGYWKNTDLVAGTNVTISKASDGALTISSSGTGSGVSSFNTRTGAVTLTSSDVTTALGYTPPNQTNPVFYTSAQFYGTGVTGYTPFANTMANWVVDTNNYSLFYLQNLNSGTDASADYVVYNDAADVDSYFIDMGINSSNYSSTTYPIFTPNSSYVFSGGGTGAITSDMFIGTSTPSSDIVLFAGGVDTTDEVMRIKSNHNVIIGTDPDTGETFQVSGSTHIKGATEFGSTVLLAANPTTALQAATKQYVDNAASSGIHIHTAVYAETSAALAAVYVQGGTTFNITDITGGNTVVTSVAHGLVVNDQIWLTTTAGNGLAINTPYFVYATPTTTSLQLSASYGGALLTGLTNATGLSYATRANSGVGAYLESSANATFTIGSYTLTVGDRILVYQQANAAWDGVYTITSLGSGASKWKLTRATDQDQYAPQDTTGLGEGDYFLVTTNSESYVLTTTGAIIIGYTPLTYTLFSSAPVYTGGTNINIAGGVISVSGTIDATLGGTGTSTVTTGDLLYGSGTNTWAKLPAGAAYKPLVMNAGGTNVEWNGLALNQANAVSGQLGISNGGTGASSAATALTNLGAQAALVSGTNIKTINSVSILGSGNIVTPTLLAESTSAFTTGSAQTYTAPANTQWVKVTVVGPGGNGAASATGRATGGSGGGVAIKWLAMNAGQTLTYTVGTASGTASSVSSGTLTITTITANSGSNGTSTAYAASLTAGPTGGTATGGDVNMAGGRGGNSYGSSTTITTNFSGAGGNCPGFGNGGQALAFVATAGQAGTGYGAGGGGAIGNATTAAGTGGIIIFEAY